MADRIGFVNVNVRRSSKERFFIFKRNLDVLSALTPYSRRESKCLQIICSISTPRQSPSRSLCQAALKSPIQREDSLGRLIVGLVWIVS